MRITFIKLLIERARSDERIFLMTPDLGFSVLESFRTAFPDRFLNTGIAEQNAIGVAAGLALSGRLVYVYSIAPFVTMRCFEQVRNDLAYMGAAVRLVGVGGGLTYGSAGPTHHSIEDIAIMRALPGMTVCCPGDPIEVRELVTASFTRAGPIYFRLNKTGEPCIHPADTRIEIGRAVPVADGTDVILITTGNMLETGKQTVDLLAREGVSAGLISMPTVKPLDIATLGGLVARGLPLVTLEEHNVIGGMGSAVAEVIAESGRGIPFARLGITDVYSHAVGSQAFLRRSFGLDAPAVAASIRRLIGK